MVLLLDRAEKQNSENWLEMQTSAFQAKTHFRIETRNHIIETIKTSRDLKAIINLRTHSFLEDYLQGEHIDWIDFDRYDLMADHIVVREKDTGLIIGTYRIISSDLSTEFYSEEEFEIESLLSEPGIKLELGRACIHKDHRNGITLSLIWKGIAHYSSMIGASHLFGCASIKTVSPRLAQSIYWNLYPYHYSEDYRIPVQPNYQFNHEIHPEDILPWDIVKNHVPPLLKSYLKAGAKLCSKPALDSLFKCTDYFTVLDLSEINKKYQSKYFG